MFPAHQCWLVEYPLNSGNKMILVAGGLQIFQTAFISCSGAFSTSGVNSINILHTHFSYKSALFSYVLVKKKTFVQKRARKMLMKLTSEWYDFGKDSWSAGPDMPDFRSDGRALTIKNRHLWLGGRSGSSSDSVAGTASILEYDVLAGKWVLQKWFLL